MRHDEHVRLMKQLCAHLDAGTDVDAGGLRQLDTTVYTDPARAEQERLEFFMSTPQCVGMSGDLAEPGSFLTHDDRPLPAEERHGLLFGHPDPDGQMNLDELLGEWFNDEFPTWHFGDMIPINRDAYDTACNWKLAMDTFGETYHFSALHKNTLFNSFHGNVQCYDQEGHLHRMVLCRREIDEMRMLPEDPWVAQNFAEIIRDEDYLMGESQQRAANAGSLDQIIFGRNEPALHHYHQTYASKLGDAPIPLLDAI